MFRAADTTVTAASCMLSLAAKCICSAVASSVSMHLSCSSRLQLPCMCTILPVGGVCSSCGRISIVVAAAVCSFQLHDPFARVTLVAAAFILLPTFTPFSPPPSIFTLILSTLPMSFRHVETHSTLHHSVNMLCSCGRVASGCTPMCGSCIGGPSSCCVLSASLIAGSLIDIVLTGLVCQFGGRWRSSPCLCYVVAGPMYMSLYA